MTRTRNGSQRASKPVELQFFPNFTGQNGSPELTLREPTTGNWIIFTFDNEQEVRELMSQAAIIFHNFPETKP